MLGSPGKVVKLNWIFRFCGWGGMGAGISADHTTAIVTKMVAAERQWTKAALGRLLAKEECDELS
jgi:hypothetical protein